MDAVDFLKAKNRICKSRDSYPNDCWACPIGNGSGGCQAGVVENQRITEEELVQIVKKWSKEHPIKTRQSEILKRFPNAKLDEEGTISICPRAVDSTFETNGKCWNMTCHQCRKEYWLAEVE